MRRCFFILSFILVIIDSGFGQHNDLKEIADELYSVAMEIKNERPDSSLKLLNTSNKTYTAIKDTTGIINCIYSIADIYKNKGRYSNAFDILWEGLYLGEQYNNPELLIQIHKELGLLYSFFNRPNETELHYRKILELSKLSKDSLKLRSSVYYAFGLRKRDQNKLDEALLYLDSCAVTREKISGEKYDMHLKVERGSVLLKQGNYKEAERLLELAKEHFEKRNSSFLVLIYMYYGDLSMAKGNIKTSIEYYNSSLKKMREFNTHTDHQIEILEKLSDAYLINNQPELAHKCLKAGKEVSDSLFSVKNNISGNLFVIKNGYQDKIREKDKEIKRKNALLIQEQQAYFKLQIVLIVLVLFIVIVLLIIRGKYQKKKFLYKQEQSDMQAAIAKERAETLMDHKNKEITSFTLQLIDKESKIESLINFIKAKVKDSSERQVFLKQVMVENDIWEEFNTRFIDVHRDFYDRLIKKCPNLTPSELKHCALIKLNFSSKEMARLLNISINSTHISRHRIRKKLGLSREDNLENFIASI